MTSFYSYLFVALHNYVTSEIYFKICILWNILVPGGAGSAGQGTQAGQGGQIGPSGQGGTLVDGQGTYVGRLKTLFYYFDTPPRISRMNAFKFVKQLFELLVFLGRDNIFSFKGK